MIKFKKGDIVKHRADTNIGPAVLSSHVGVVLGRNEPPDDLESFLCSYNGMVRVRWFRHGCMIPYLPSSLGLHDKAL